MLSRVFPAFSIGACIVYMSSMIWHPKLTLFTYVPRNNTWLWGAWSSEALQRNAPGMYWYSWLVTGLIGGLICAAVALAAPEAIRKRFWSGWAWVVPVVLTAILTYVEWPWFAGAVRRMFS